MALREHLMKIILLSALSGTLLHSLQAQTTPSMLELGKSQHSIFFQMMKARDQQVQDALSNGDAKCLASLTSPDFLFVAEDSQIHVRNELLGILRPDPQSSGIPPVKMRDYTIHKQRDTAIVTYHLYESGYYLGSPLTGHDTITATWQRLNAGWRLRLLHMTAVPMDPPAVMLPLEELDQLTGRYRAGSSITSLSREGDHIVEDSNSGRALLKAEGRDLLFKPGLPRLRLIFLRDTRGNVVGYVSRNENRGIKFTKIS